MFSSTKVAEIMNGVLNQEEYSVPIKALEKRVEAAKAEELSRKIDSELAEKTEENVEDKALEH